MSLVFVGMGLMAFLSASMLAIDVGMLMTARNQAQNSADAGALAGATALLYDNYDDHTASGPAVTSAITAGTPNQVMGGDVSLTPDGRQFLTDPTGEVNRVRVTVFRRASRGNPVSTLIARYFGMATADIGATATAEASPANAMTCVKPFTIPDQVDVKSARTLHGTATASTTRSTTRATRCRRARRTSTSRRTTTTTSESGLHRLQQRSQPGPAPGAARRHRQQHQRQLLLLAVDDRRHGRQRLPLEHRELQSHASTLGRALVQEPGAMEGPTVQGAEELMAQDPGAHWDDATNRSRAARSARTARGSFRFRSTTRSTTTTVSATAATLRLQARPTGSGSSSKASAGNGIYGRIIPIAGIPRRPAERHGGVSQVRFGSFNNESHGATRGFHRQLTTKNSNARSRALLRAGGVPVGIVEGRGAERRARTSSSSTSAPTLRPAWRPSSGCARRSPAVAIFAIAAGAEPDLILQAMRAGANEFFPWTPGGATQASRAMEESFHGAVRRTAARRDAANAGTRQPCVTHVFLGAKGGAGTTTSRSTAPSSSRGSRKRPTLILDLKPCLGEVALFLGVRPRFTVLDAIENLHRLDKDFLKELVAKHKSGLDILAAPNSSIARTRRTPARSRSCCACSRTYEYIVIDAGNTINSCAVAALYAADTVFLVTNPDVPSIRNAQRLVDRVRQLGAGSERVKVLLNRVSDQHLIAPKQIETALGYGIHHTFTSDYRTVSTALNSGVPLTLRIIRSIAGSSTASRGRCSACATSKPSPRSGAHSSASSNRTCICMSLSLNTPQSAGLGNTRPARASKRRGRSTSS